ncbi:MAG: VWA domain-containing protein [Acidobacteriia bacterium]|nr:VWA domain-containing protein [Terriglobia bacterium]
MSLRRAFAIGLALIAAWLVFSTAPARAQGSQGPIAPKPGAPVQKAPDNAIRVRVALVNAPVTVHDAKGELVLDLKKENLHVFDNGVEQNIETFDLGGEPLSAVLVFETSSRVAPLLPAVQKSAIVFTQTVIGPSGDAAVLGYNDDVERLLPFTADHDKIEKTIANLKTGTSGTRLYDALSMAVGLLRDRPPSRRRIIIVVAEARDAGSEEKLGEVLREAQLSNIVIYTVGLSTAAAALRAPPKQSGPIQAAPPGTFGLPPVPGTVQTPTTEQQRTGYIDVDLLSLAEWAVENAKAVVKDRPLEVATVATGGMYQSTFRDRSIEDVVDAIGGELNAQYTLSYRPTGSEAAGYHQIKVTVDRPDVKVRTRPGYYIEAKN